MSGGLVVQEGQEGSSGGLGRFNRVWSRGL